MNTSSQIHDHDNMSNIGVVTLTLLAEDITDVFDVFYHSALQLEHLRVDSRQL